MGRQQELARQRRRTKRNANVLSHRISGWMKRRAKMELDAAIGQITTGKHKLKKSANAELDKELLKILTDFGIRQISSSGKGFSAGFGGEWVVTPQLIERITKLKAIKVTRLSRNIKARVLATIRRIMSEANRMEPKPSVGQVARQMREAFSPTAKSPVWALDPKRAALIARTESQQNEQTGLFEGAKEVGVEAKEWISSGNVNHGDRRHDLMDGQQQLIDKPFVNPTTLKKLQHPGDPSAHISETANCGCGWRAIRLKDIDPDVEDLNAA